MDENNNEPQKKNYSLVKSDFTKSIFKKTDEWFRDLFKGYWYGMTDLFLASWQNIVLLVMLLLIPLVYGIVCAFGYWNPINNLGKMEIPIFDQDRTFLKVEAKTTTGTYKIGALKSATIDNKEEDFINSDNSISNVNIDSDLVKEFAEGKAKDLVLNNGLKIDPSDTVSVTPMNSWDLIKKNVLVKKDASKADQDTSFGFAAYPNEELNFKNFRYVNDQNKINKYWQTGSYQAQIKIGDGYGAALVGLQGIAYANPLDAAGNEDVAKFVGEQSSLPIMDTFQTFQTNFVSAFVLGDMSEFASQIVDQMQPFTNAFKNNANANETFGTKGQTILDFLATNKPTDKKAQAVIKAVSSSINPDEYYLVSSEDEFVKNAGLSNLGFAEDANFDNSTLFGNNLKNGTFAKWLEKVNFFASSNGYANVKADASSSLKLIQNIEALYSETPEWSNAKQLSDAEMDYLAAGKGTTPINEKDFISGVQEMLTKPAVTDKPGLRMLDSIIGAFSPLYGKNFSKVYDAVNSHNAFKTTTPFESAAAVPSSKANMFGLFTKMVTDNEKTIFPFFDSIRSQLIANGQTLDLVPANLLGTIYGAMTTSLKANGANPNALIHMEPSRGQDIAVYGIGLGQMFVFLGIYIGFTMLRAVINRNKQYAKLKWSNWYISKFLIYLTIGVVIVTLITWIMYGGGWHKYISASAMGYEYLWFLMAMFPILAIIIGLQYATSPMVGAALAVLYLGFNVTCSGSSYPGWMELGFYRGVTWIMPFKYLIEGSDQILYGVNLVHQHWAQTPNAAHVLHMANNRILQLWGYSTCFFAFFFMLGFFGAIRSYKVTLYGSARGKVVAHTFEYLKEETLLKKFIGVKTNKKGRTVTKYNWNAIIGPMNPTFYETTRKLRSERIRFKWYKDLREKRRIEEIEHHSDR